MYLTSPAYVSFQGQLGGKALLARNLRSKGEKITLLIKYATNPFLPLSLVCVSGGARVQEGSLSLTLYWQGFFNGIKPYLLLPSILGSPDF
jgi:acetyl-CoA carboxylase carboxyltransferase component